MQADARSVKPVKLRGAFIHIAMELKKLTIRQKHNKQRNK